MIMSQHGCGFTKKVLTGTLQASGFATGPQVSL
jgi:hypothetical protein